MKGQLASRVRRRAVTSHSAPQPSRRKWVIRVTLGVLLAVVVAIVGTIASRGAYLNMNAPDSMMAYRLSQEMPRDQAGLVDTDDATYAAYIAGNGVKAQGWDRMIIRTATVALTVKDVTTAIERVKAITAQQGGYVFSSESHEQGEYTYATVTIYVPAKEFDQIMPILRGLDGQVEKVTSESVTSSDVTEEYTDLQSQLRNLKATEARMLDLQTRATELEDVLAVDRELRTVQGEIEQIQGRINYLDKRTDMSTVTMQLSPVAAPPLKPESNWQPFEAASKAWDASLQMLGNTVTAIITVGVFLWWLVPFAVIGVWVVLRARKRSTVVQAEG
jgi:hypothetical protein